MKCGAVEGRRRSFGPIVWKIKKYYNGFRKTGISYIQ